MGNRASAPIISFARALYHQAGVASRLARKSSLVTRMRYRYRLFSSAVLAITAGVFLAQGEASAAPVLWFCDSNGALGKVDVSTGAAEKVGRMPVVLVDLAFSPGGELFGVSEVSLYRIDTTTARVAEVGRHDRKLNALVFAKDGTLYGASAESRSAGSLYELNPSTGAARRIGPMGAASSGDLAIVGGRMYVSTIGRPDDLRQVDPATGRTTIVGSTNRADVWGLASPDGVDLYGMSGSAVFRLDPATGAAAPAAVTLAGFGRTTGTTFFEEARPGPATAATSPSATTPDGTRVESDDDLWGTLVARQSELLRALERCSCSQRAMVRPSEGLISQIETAGAFEQRLMIRQAIATRSIELAAAQRLCSNASMPPGASDRTVNEPQEPHPRNEPLADDIPVLRRAPNDELGLIPDASGKERQ